MEIKNLDGLSKLEKLQLDNNIIMKITGLDHLVNLKWLDLSFNNISKIEGLDKLANLTDLSLFQNHISQIEGMENLTKLNYLSLGNNEITSADALTKLQVFKNLQVLIVQGNPFCKNDTDNDARYTVIATLPQLKYLDYMMIDDESVKAATVSHSAIHKAAEEALQTKQEMTKDSLIKELEEANIADIYNLIEKLKDPDMKKLEFIPKQAEYWAKFEEELKEYLGTYTEKMKKSANERKEAMEICEKLLLEEEKDTEGKAVKAIDSYRSRKKHVFRDIKGGKLTIAEIEALKKDLKKLDYELMRIEMDHVELVSSQVTNKFDTTINGITTTMTSDTDKAYFSMSY